MARPAVLVLDPRADRLRDLGQRLTADGYEVVPVSDPARGQRFAQSLESVLIVATSEALAAAADPAELLAGLHAQRNGADRTVVVLGQKPEEEEGLPESVAFLSIGGLDPPEVARRLRLLLLGHELGLQPDARLTSLVGDLSQTPLLELLRGLAAARVSSRIELHGGVLFFDYGRVVAATAGSARGLKAFCRLGRLHEGPLRLVPRQAPAEGFEGEVTEDLDTLILAAIEDSLGESPDPRTRLEIDLKPAFFNTPFSAVQQQVLSSAQRGTTLQQLLDTLPARDGEIVNEVLRLEDLGVVIRREPEAAVRIVTDSTADLPPDLARAHGIAVVPLTVAFGKEVYRDRVDLQPGRFYRLLAERKEHPVSSPPPSAELAPLYRDQIGRGYDVISLHISAKLSKTYENAHAAAAEQAPDNKPRRGRLTVLDTGQVSAGLGLLALFAARMAARNEPGERIVRRLRDMAPRIHTLFVVDTLDYLARGGRIGKARALLGGLLRIKPILGVVDGEVAPVGQARGGRSAHPRILELLRDRVDPKRPLIAALCHANAPAWADRLASLLREHLKVAELIQAEVGPVVGAHVGPGVVGVAAFQPTDDEMRWIAAG